MDGGDGHLPRSPAVKAQQLRDSEVASIIEGETILQACDKNSGGRIGCTGGELAACCRSHRLSRKTMPRARRCLTLGPIALSNVVQKIESNIDFYVNGQSDRCRPECCAPESSSSNSTRLCPPRGGRPPPTRRRNRCRRANRGPLAPQIAVAVIAADAILWHRQDRARARALQGIAVACVLPGGEGPRAGSVAFASSCSFRACAAGAGLQGGGRAARRPPRGA